MHRMGSYFEPSPSSASSSLGPPVPPPTSSIPPKPVLKRPSLAAIGIPTTAVGGGVSPKVAGRFGIGLVSLSEINA